MIEFLKRQPTIVEPNDIHNLRQEILEVSKGNKFLLIIGDCAESFSDCSDPCIMSLKYLFYDQVCTSLEQALMTRQVVKIGRVAGQFAKPWSSAYEMGG